MRSWTSSQRTTLTEFSVFTRSLTSRDPEAAGARGWPGPPMVLDPGMIGGEHGAGGENQSEKREANARQTMRRAAGEKRGQKRQRNGGVERVALGEAELAGRVAHSLKYPDRGEDGD